MHRKLTAGLTALALGLAGSLLVVSPAHAATLTVLNNADSGAGSLRDRIAAAGSGDTIVFDDALGATTIILLTALDIDKGVTIDGGGDITIGRSGPVQFAQLGMWPDTPDQNYIVKNITIQGAVAALGSGVSASFGSNNDTPNDVTLSNVTIRNQNNNFAPIGDFYQVDGNVLVENSSFLNNVGGNGPYGGMYFEMTHGDSIVVRASTFIQNTTLNAGGAISFSNTGSTDIRLESNRFQLNKAATSGGAVYGTGISNFTINDAAGGGGFFDHNEATAGNGGAIALESVTGAVDIREADFWNNKAPDGDGGSLWVGGSSVDISDVRVTSSTASGNGGGAFINSGNWSVALSLFAFNDAGSSGGGFYSPGAYADSSVTDSTFSNNSALTGGAFASLIQSSDLTVSRSVFAGNSFTSSGGAIYASPISGAGRLIIDSSTFSGQVYEGNSLATGASIRVASLNGTLQVVNSTFDETDIDNGEAIGIGTFGDGTVEILNSTLRGPAAYRSEHTGASESTVQNSILEGTEGPAMVTSDVQGGEVAISYSVLNSALPSAGVDVAGNQLNTDPELGVLQDNGGTGGMWTRLPLAGSPAIDKGDPAFAAALPFDERGDGFPRVSGGRIDVGAVEVQAVLPATGPADGGLIALLAMLLLGAGSALVVSRRRSLRA